VSGGSANIVDHRDQESWLIAKNIESETEENPEDPSAGKADENS
jgi:hypothetical protein